MSQVHFDYGTNNVLKNVDLDVAPGQLVVVTGGPRSGKSTLAALAAGALAPVHGTIELDGVDVGDIDDAKLRRAIRVLTEEPFLFGRTVRENLEMGAGLEGVPDDVLHAALHAAGADEVVAELPNGLDEVLGDRGLTLSGGQRQRLALARALVAPPRVLILDDALLAVNPNMEVDIIRRIRAHAPRTRDPPSLAPRGPGRARRRRPRPARTPATSPSDDTEEPDVAAGHDMPIDTSLLDAMAKLPPDRDTPPVGDADCRAVGRGAADCARWSGRCSRPFIGVAALVAHRGAVQPRPGRRPQVAPSTHIEDKDFGPAQLIAFIGFLLRHGAPPA